MRSFFFVFCLFLLGACSPTVYTRLNPPAEPVSVDANIAEHGLMRFYAREIRATYSMSNDNENLYLCARIDDPEMQQKIMRNGLIVYIDTTKKPLRQIGITYPVPGQRNFRKEEAPDKGELEEISEFKRTRQTFFLKHNTVRLFGFKNHFTGIYPMENRSGVRVKMDWDSTGSLVYEMLIPFKSFYRDKLTATDANRIFSLSFVVNAFDLPPGKPTKGRLLDNVSIGVGGGMGMGSGFGTGVGVGTTLGGGPQGGMGPTTEKNEFSTQFQLSVKP